MTGEKSDVQIRRLQIKNILIFAKLTFFTENMPGAAGKFIFLTKL